MAENRPPTSVTDAQEAADKDYRQRVKRYTISMIIRVVCLLLAFAFTGWLRWVMLGGAVVLPYFAVVIANARNERLFDYDMAGMQDSPRPMLSPEATHRADTWQENDEGAQDEPVIIGEVLGETRASDHEGADDEETGPVCDARSRVEEGDEADD